MFDYIKSFFTHGRRSRAYHDIIECLVAALEAKDLYTSGHSNRVADMTFDLAKVLRIGNAELEDIHIAAHLHDIGKLGIPDHILNKKDRLLPDEWDQIKQHPEIGSKILSKSKELRQVAEIVLHHHERWDGCGYPKGLKHENIPLGARIIAVADSIDAMVSERPYRSALSWEQCMKEIERNKGVQFDPMVVETAMKLWNRWEVSS